MLYVAFSLLIVLGVCGAVLSVRWQKNRALETINQWAAQHKFQVIKRDDITPAGVGAVSKRDKRQTFKITVRGPAGEEKTGVIIVGTKRSSASRATEITWDD